MQVGFHDNNEIVTISTRDVSYNDVSDANCTIAPFKPWENRCRLHDQPHATCIIIIIVLTPGSLRLMRDSI